MKEDNNSQFSILNSPLIPPGYKQTEVGVIPEDWEILELENSARVVDSLHQTPNFSEDGYPMVRVADIKTGTLSLKGALMVADTVFAEFTKNYKPKRGDIVLSRVGSYGVSSFVETDEPFCMGQNTVVLQPKLPARFLYFALNSHSIRQQIENGSYGSGYKSLSLKNITELLIPLPPTKAEQEAIAEALSDADALNESLENLLTKKRNIKQGAMQWLLTPPVSTQVDNGKLKIDREENSPFSTIHSPLNKRLPGFSGEWEVKRLGEIGCFFKGSGVTKDQAMSGSLPCVRYGEIYTRHNDYIKAFHSWISRHVATTATRLKYGDILFAGSGETKEEIGKCVAFVNDVEAYAGGDIVILRNENADPLFLGYYLNTSSINLQKASRGQGDAVVHISAASLGAIQCMLPAIAEQTAIAAILSDMDAEIAALETKLTKTRQLKQGMMQELLTGRIRLV